MPTRSDAVLAAVVMLGLAACSGEVTPAETVTATETTAATATETVTAAENATETITYAPDPLETPMGEELGDISSDEGLWSTDAELTNLELNDAIAPFLGDDAPPPSRDG